MSKLVNLLLGYLGRVLSSVSKSVAGKKQYRLTVKSGFALGLKLGLLVLILVLVGLFLADLWRSGFWQLLTNPLVLTTRAGLEILINTFPWVSFSALGVSFLVLILWRQT